MQVDWEATLSRLPPPVGRRVAASPLASWAPTAGVRRPPTTGNERATDGLQCAAPATAAGQRASTAARSPPLAPCAGPPVHRPARICRLVGSPRDSDARATGYIQAPPRVSLGRGKGRPDGRAGEIGGRWGGGVGSFPATRGPPLIANRVEPAGVATGRGVLLPAVGPLRCSLCEG